MGGGTAQDNDGFDVIYAFDLATNSWINKATHGDSSIPIDESIEEQYPEARKCHTCAQNGQCKPLFNQTSLRIPKNDRECNVSKFWSNRILFHLNFTEINSICIQNFTMQINSNSTKFKV